MEERLENTRPKSFTFIRLLGYGIVPQVFVLQPLLFRDWATWVPLSFIAFPPVISLQLELSHLLAGNIRPFRSFRRA